jgi:hypothetical protein
VHTRRYRSCGTSLLIVHLGDSLVNIDPASVVTRSNFIVLTDSGSVLKLEALRARGVDWVRFSDEIVEAVIGDLRYLDEGRRVFLCR